MRYPHSERGPVIEMHDVEVTDPHRCLAFAAEHRPHARLNGQALPSQLELASCPGSATAGADGPGTGVEPDTVAAHVRGERLAQPSERACRGGGI